MVLKYLVKPAEAAQTVSRLLAKEVLGFDTETTGLNPREGRLRLLTFATPEGEVFIFDAFKVPVELLSPLFDEKGPLLVGHNLKFDLQFLLGEGIFKAPGTRLWDTGLAQQVLLGLPRMPALKDLAPDLSKELQKSAWDSELSKEQLEYAARDALVVLTIWEAQRASAKALKLEKVIALENRALPAVAWMEFSGVPIDLNIWAEALARAEEKRARLLERLPRGINWDSPVQVLNFLRKEGVDVEDTRDYTLAKFAQHPIVSALIEYREAAKIVSSYGSKWFEYGASGRIYPSWQQIGTETGRMSCRSPNVQQVSREPLFRSAFRPGEGRVLIKADYSQIELRIVAELTGEPNLLEAFLTGKDLHTLTASLILDKDPSQVTKEDRQLAKALNFGLIYGLGAEGFQKYARNSYGVNLSIDEARELRKKFFKAYPGIRWWHQEQKEGEEIVRTFSGRMRKTDRFTEKLNTPVQGTGADGLKEALALLWERRGEVGENVFPVISVHDEIVLEAPEEDALKALGWLVRNMEDGMNRFLRFVPVAVEGGVYRDWGVTEFSRSRDGPSI